jgi:hypothetical protein
MIMWEAIALHTTRGSRTNRKTRREWSNSSRVSRSPTSSVASRAITLSGIGSAHPRGRGEQRSVRPVRPSAPAGEASRSTEYPTDERSPTKQRNSVRLTAPEDLSGRSTALRVDVYFTEVAAWLLQLSTVARGVVPWRGTARDGPVARRQIRGRLSSGWMTTRAGRWRSAAGWRRDGTPGGHPTDHTRMRDRGRTQAAFAPYAGSPRARTTHARPGIQRPPTRQGDPA